MVVSVACILATCPYFDNNLKFDILMQVVLSATLSCPYHMLRDFHTSTDTLVQNFLLVF